MSNLDVLLNLIKNSIWNEQCNIDRTVNEEILEELKVHSVIAIPQKSIGVASSCKKIEDEWNSYDMQSMTNFGRVMYEQQEMINLLERYNIQPIILKGISAAMYYPYPVLRTMGDVDFIVKPNEFETARKILLEAGYEEDKGYHKRHIGFAHNGIRFELHRYFSMGGEKGNSAIDQIIKDAFSMSTKHTLDSFYWYSFDANTNGLILLEHLRQHIGGGIGFRHLIDWMMFVNAHLDDSNWDEFKLLTDKCGITTFAINMTAACEQYLGLQHNRTWAQTADTELCKEIINFIFQKGNLGHKKTEDSSRYISALNLNGKGILQALEYEQKSGLIHWHAAKKYKILKPFAWIYGICHHIKMLKQDGENLISLKNGFAKSKEQKSLVEKIIGKYE